MPGSGGFAKKAPAWPSITPAKLRQMNSPSRDLVDLKRTTYLTLSRKYPANHPVVKAAREDYEMARGRKLTGEGNG